ncbi:MAG: hypothetical protein HZB79_08365 [Deltaproteobacteria bacterium]|nr:hypothetical protein [Deltaproteobacteria bacterium]MBI5893646.1 hypothetical protein [Deltaproteobacteria bacterium]
MEKSITTLRLKDDRLRLLKAIAGYEGKTLTDIFGEMTDEYIDRHKETLEMLNIPGFAMECKEGLKEIKKGKGKKLHELDS